MEDAQYLVNVDIVRDMLGVSVIVINTYECTIPQIFKLLPKRKILFDHVKDFITNRKYALFHVF